MADKKYSDVELHFVSRSDMVSALDFMKKFADENAKWSNGVACVRDGGRRGERYIVEYKGKKYIQQDTMRVAILLAWERASVFQEELSNWREDIKTESIREMVRGPANCRLDHNSESRCKTKWEQEEFLAYKETSESENEQGADEMDEDVKLLKQFKQMIFYGPPGTGKTYSAKRTLEELFGVDELPDLQGDQWDIVQFHPSYNYEDFVRGVQVNTNDEGQIKYETKNRIFAEMCDKASRDEGNAYALIIDEINRANVSSVLGELIYALEYRGESVSTPYEIIGSRLLTIPPNLYIIGTMNTADRTIGALDYAVRRRFAFVHCPPDESLIKDAKAKSVFSKVKHIFAEFLSPDFDAADVEIGHSYFMAAGEELRGKIQYQVVPILEEYVKDGVLLPKAKEKIKELLQEKQEPDFLHLHPLHPPPGKFLWTRDDRNDTNGVGRTVLSIVKDYVENDKPQNITELQQAFPDRLAVGQYHTVALEDDPSVQNNQRRYFINDPIDLPSGERIVVCTEWGATGQHDQRWGDFIYHVREELGYIIIGA